MIIRETEKIELENLERSADDLLSDLATAGKYISAGNLRKLEQIAGRAAKIAFGSGQANLLSQQMINLIKWTDHLNENVWVDNFRVALQKRQLAAPF